MNIFRNGRIVPQNVSSRRRTKMTFFCLVTITVIPGSSVQNVIRIFWFFYGKEEYIPKIAARITRWPCKAKATCHIIFCGIVSLITKNIYANFMKKNLTIF